MDRFDDTSDAEQEGYEYEYAFALVKTSAALNHTIQLATRHDLEAVTELERPFQLFGTAKAGEELSLRHEWIEREGY